MRVTSHPQALAHAKNNPKVSADQTHKEYAYRFEEGMEKAIKTFRQRGTGGDAVCHARLEPQTSRPHT